MLRVTVFVYSVCISAQLFAQKAAAGSGVASTSPQGKESIFSLLLKGGPIMVPLAICSIVAVTVAFERFISLRYHNIVPKDFFDKLKKGQVEKKDPNFNEMQDFCEKSRTPIGRILESGILKWKIYEELEGTEKTLEDVAIREVGRMKRSLRPLKNVAAVSPLLGLLGTVFGMIRAFQTVALSTASFGKADKLASGIYEAMVTTAAGLSIAIPTLLLFYFLNSRVDNFADEIEMVCNKFIDEFIHRPKTKS